jgi:hypothetical protein
MSSGDTDSGIFVLSSTFGSRGLCDGGMSPGSISNLFGLLVTGPLSFFVVELAAGILVFRFLRRRDVRR